LAKGGADASAVAKENMKALRKHIHKFGGPTDLASLAAAAGMTAPTGQLRFDVSPEELEKILDEHKRRSRLRDRAPHAEYEVNAVQRMWNRIQHSSDGHRTQRELYKDWCLEQVRSNLLGRIESSLPGSPAARLRYMQAVETAVCELLEAGDADILESLLQDPSGVRVRAKIAMPKATTEELLNEPLFTLQSDLDMEDSDEITGVSIRLQDQL
jgi:hypothetical protein